jgi:hypothetical protein
VALCLKRVDGANCLKQLKHAGTCNRFPSVWTEISHDPEEKTRKKIVKAGFATPRGGDKGGYQNHVSRSSRVIVPLEHSHRVDFVNYEQGAIVRITIPQMDSLVKSGKLYENDEGLEIAVNGRRQKAFVLYRSQEELNAFPIKKKWVPCGHRINGVESTRRSTLGEDYGHFLARIPRGLKAGIQQGIFAPEYVGKQENYVCQVFLTLLAYKTIGQPSDTNLLHVEEILDQFHVLDYDRLEMRAIVNKKHETTCPLCMRPIESHELHEAIDPSQVPGLANSGVQLAETRSTLVNLFHLEPLLYEPVLGHNVKNIAWGHAHCNTLLAQRRTYSLNELRSFGKPVDSTLYWNDNQSFIRSGDHRAWVSVTPIEFEEESFTHFLTKTGAVEALSKEEDELDD